MNEVRESQGTLFGKLAGNPDIVVEHPQCTVDISSLH